jgi:hypothetical protein
MLFAACLIPVQVEVCDICKRIDLPKVADPQLM